MSIVINTPNGQIGRLLALRLLEAGRPLTVISRSADKVADLVKQGARLVQGSTDDAAVLERALAGAEALFWLTPPVNGPDFVAWSREAALTAAKAVKAHGVKRVVVLSSVGAQHGAGTGPVNSLKAVEEAFKAVCADVTILRPGFFMENFLRDVGTLAKTGSLFMPVPRSKAVPFVAVADIAAKAAEVLLDAGWKGHRYVGVHGPADVTYAELEATFSEALGRPIRYVQVSLEDARKGMVGAGIPGWMADVFAEMYGGIGDGRMDPAEPRSAQTTTPTSLAKWAREVLKPAVEQAASAAA
ncbi:NmrA family NAD(P)-binding protein [Pyxidicoccus fallax]|uniref:NmrA family NAD(P)-binding protein n=1 Tax=Pyxidicoccus fallax TaxID=394095 RepID=A0A848L7R3_9BACT|nr:NAD(P)H-binding protein [Pyxidicoccus fallax]NMO15030.1 NmrA family NAD(P)-binding protein [Pyxidicoccus fallax]NPC78052.1 NmrA family NAD(P)-binding protein [Pyxidicoccus fallax]